MSKIKSLFISKSVGYWNNGLISTSNIGKGQIIASISYQDCLCIDTIPKQFIKDIKMVLNKQLEDQTVLILYLIHLKIKFKLNLKVQINKQIDQYNFSYNDWLKSNTYGFVRFNENVIRKSNDIDLLIEYLAYRNHLITVSTKIFNILFTHLELIHQWFQQISLQCWIQLYIWGNQFKNTRSFGYTKNTTLIPWFDYLNYSPSNQSQIQLKISSSQINTQIQGQQNKNLQQSSDSSSDQLIDLSLKDYSNETKFCLISKINISKGQQLFLNYGQRSNKYLLMWYGFTCQNNPKDYLTIYIDTFNPSSQQIRFDKLYTHYNKIKLKKKVLNFKLLSFIRKQYYPSYFKKHQNLIWSIPISIQYQIFILSNLVKRMEKYKSNISKGDWQNISYTQDIKWIEIYQHQQRLIMQWHISAIYDIIQYFQIGIQILNKNNQSQQILNQKSSKIKQVISNYEEYFRCFSKIIDIKFKKMFN